MGDALLRIADDVDKNGIYSGSQYKAAREMLLRRPPRLSSGAFEMHEGETSARFAIRISTLPKVPSLRMGHAAA